MVRVLTPRDYRVMPWKNGGGTTTEIHIHPDGAGWDDFEWRVGIADIARSGPFSSFPGIDRSILLLDCPEGSGMRLTIDGADVELPLRRFHDFRGESMTSGTLLGAPVRDFNVMSRRARLSHRCGFERVANGDSWVVAGREAGFVHLVDGRATVLGAEAPRALSAGESLLFAGDDAVTLRADRGAIEFVWARFAPA